MVRIATADAAGFDSGTHSPCPAQSGMAKRSARSTGGSAFHTEGTVEFRAHYMVDDQPGEQYENSRFVRENGLWVYVEAEE